MSELVLTERDGAVAVVTLNRPDALNALSDELMEQLVAMLQDLDRDDEVRCIVLGGNDKAFAAGADVAELARSSAIDLYYQRRIERWDAIRGLWTPLVAAVSGYCLGGGCELALACDLIVASESAKFGQPETGSRRVARRRRDAAADARGRQGARHGRDPERSVPDRARGAGRGLVARVVPEGEWLDEAKRVAHEIASKAPIATRLAKEAVDRAYEGPLQLGLEYERRLLYLAFASDDAKEGLTAFMEKRKPQFKGR